MRFMKKVGMRTFKKQAEKNTACKINCECRAGFDTRQIHMYTAMKEINYVDDIHYLYYISIDKRKKQHV